MHAISNKTKLTHEELMKPIGDQKFLKAVSFLDFTLGLSAAIRPIFLNNNKITKYSQ